MAQRRKPLPEDEPRTFVPGEPDVQVVEKWLDRRLGPKWHGWDADNSRVPDTAMFCQVKRNDAGRWVLTGLLLLGESITADRLRVVPVAEVENGVNLTADGGDWRAELDALPALERGAGMSPEDFSQLVAEHYKAWARHVAHPAAAMAAEWNVKVPTMHTWIREARLRGYLPPARRGKGRG